MQHEDLTDKIIGCAYRVFNKLGPDYLEAVYEKALAIELRKAKLSAKFQVPVPVYYDGEIIGDYFADIIVEDLVVVEIKSVRALIEAHGVQLVNYLTATRKDVGLLINFGDNGVEVRRKVRDLKSLRSDPVHPVIPSSPPPPHA